MLKKKKYDFSNSAHVKYYDYAIEESSPDKLIFDDSFDYDKFSSEDSFKFSINKTGDIEIINPNEEYGKLNAHPYML
ncbi:hypothetical protein [Borreliella bavariensis]|uniref:hypothetical protein n=1 Tax=Borreliella bavariensis TaxID=664662 RepID=UPI001F1EC3C2|nr:hypothetical protein [Borreliella bavariensis]